MIKEPLPVPAMAALGGVMGALTILSYRCESGDNLCEAFVDKPEFIVWASVIIVLSATIAALASPLWGSMLSLMKDFRSSRRDVFDFTIMAVILVSIPTIVLNVIERGGAIPPWSPLLHHDGRMIVIFLFALAAFIPAIAGMRLVQIAAQSFNGFIRGNGKLKRASIASVLSRYQSYRKALHEFLAALGLIVSMIVLAASALRVALIEGKVAKVEDYPFNLIVVYGLYFTGVIIVVYIKAYLSITQVGREIVEWAFPIKSATTFEQVYRSRAAMESLLQLNIGAGQSLRGAIVVLSPLLTSLGSSLLGVAI